jgi:hypothetical protein
MANEPFVAVNLLSILVTFSQTIGICTADYFFKSILCQKSLLFVTKQVDNLQILLVFWWILFQPYSEWLNGDGQITCPCG